jgi:RNA polymerase sigma factor (sigma-70 family)
MDKKNRLIEQIRAGDQKAITRIYTMYKADFLLYSSRFSIDEDDAVDIYQDSIITLYENIRSGKLASLSSSLKTYLFAIGKYKIFNSLKVKLHTADFAEYESLLEEDNEDERLLLKEENIAKLQVAYQQLGTKCQDVVKLFYYENLSIEEIKERLGYSSKDVVKSQKSRCLRQIREILSKS